MSSLVRRLQIRAFKRRGSVEKVPCPFGRMIDTGLVSNDGVPIMAPVMVWPKFAPKSEPVEADAVIGHNQGPALEAA